MMKKMSNTTLGKLKNIGKYFVWGSVYNASLCKNDWVILISSIIGPTQLIIIDVKQNQMSWPNIGLVWNECLYECLLATWCKSSTLYFSKKQTDFMKGEYWHSKIQLCTIGKWHMQVATCIHILYVLWNSTKSWLYADHVYR